MDARLLAIIVGVGAAGVWLLRRPLTGIVTVVGNVTDTLAASPVLQPGGIDYVGAWVRGLPADIAGWLEPPLPPPTTSPTDGGAEADEWLRWHWVESGEYHPTYNPSGKR